MTFKTPYKMVESKDKFRERVAKVAKKKISCHNCGSKAHYSNNFPKAKKKVYAIEKVPEEESPTDDSESDSMGDSIREHSDDDQDPRDEFLVEYQEEAPLEIQYIQLEAGIPQDTANKNLCKHTKDAQTFLVTSTKGMAYIHGTATKMTVCIDNAQHLLITDISAIEKLPEEEFPTDDSESDSMGDYIREQSDDDQDPREELLVEYQEEPPLEIQDIQLEAGMPQDTANKNLCKHTQDAQKLIVTPTNGMAYMHGTATKMTVCIDNAQHPLIIDSGAHCSIVARNYLDNHFSNWEKQLLHTRAKNFKSTSGKMNSFGKIIEEIIIPHRKGHIRLNPKFVVLDDAHIQGFLLGTDYQRMYGIDIYNSKNRHITIGTNKEKKFSLDIYQISSQNPLEELLNEFREG
ncbi:hypothetical protein O181_100370, partial [Austropuccinia psidii MF-1]|nr:hypothetical protein [Austropuccinia psidii MF-1]